LYRLFFVFGQQSLLLPALLTPPFVNPRKISDDFFAGFPMRRGNLGQAVAIDWSSAGEDIVSPNTAK
jgi:hypothetical protein